VLWELFVVKPKSVHPSNMVKGR